MLGRVAARRPHVLVVPTPGGSRVRIALEAAVAERRWVVAASPADADLLVVAGSPGARLIAVADAVWHTVPAPRARARVRFAGDVGRTLDAAAARLAAGSAADGGDGDVPDDPPMADLADQDRDGLALDALHVPLGPVLPGWPPGLVVHAVLAGELITAATAEVLDVRPGSPARADGLSPDTARLDVLARILDLAGATTAARRARRLRDGSSTADGRREFGRRLARARVLAWTLRGIPLPRRGAGADGAAGDADVRTLVRRYGRELGTDAPRDPRTTPADAVAALVGLELGAARTALAALDPDTAQGATPTRRTAPGATSGPGRG